MLNKSVKSVHPCLVSDLSWKDVSFSLLSVMLAEIMTYALYYGEVHSLYTHFVESFIIDGY